MSYSVGPYTLYPYQERIVDQLRSLIARLRSEGKPPHIVLQAPCGAGKGVLVAYLAAATSDKGNRFLFMVHGRSLVSQVTNKLAECGLHHGLLMANSQDVVDHDFVSHNQHTMHQNQIIVASRDTYESRVVTRKSIQDFDVQLCTLDEAHLGHNGATYQRFLRENLETVIVGFTATPAKGNGYGFGDLYQGLLQGVTHQELLDGGFIVPPLCFGPSSVDMSGVDVNPETGEYVQEQAAERFDRSELIGDLIRDWELYGDNRPTVVYAQSVKHSVHIAEMFCGSGILAEHVDADTPMHERKRVYDGIANGKIKVVTNYGVLRCLDSETEILTSVGWKGIEDLSENDEVANWHKDASIDFSRPIQVIRRDRAPGESMVSAIGRRINLRITDSHEMVFDTDDFGWRKLPAYKLVNRQFQFPVCGIANPCQYIPNSHSDSLSRAKINNRVSGNAYALRKRMHISNDESLTLAKERLNSRISMKYLSPCDLTDDHCKFIGFCLGDLRERNAKSGGIVRRISITPDKYPEIISEVRRLLLACGIKASEFEKPASEKSLRAVIFQIPRGTGFGPQKKPGCFEIEPYLQKNCEYLWSLNEKQFDMVMQGYWMADADHGDKISCDLSVIRVSSTDLEKLSAIQAIATCRGYHARISFGKLRKTGSLPIHRLHLNKHKDRFFIGNDRLAIEPDWRPERVWCVTVNSGMIITRRHGKTAVVGNCGVDIPQLGCGVLACSMKSLNSYLQSVGRLQRACSSVYWRGGRAKDSFILIDHGGNLKEHKWPQAERFWTLDPGKTVQENTKEHDPPGKQETPLLHCYCCGAEWTPKGDDHGCPYCGASSTKRGTELCFNGEHLEQIEKQELEQKTPEQKAWTSTLFQGANKGWSIGQAIKIWESKTGKKFTECDVGPRAPFDEKDQKITQKWPKFGRRKRAS